MKRYLFAFCCIVLITAFPSLSVFAESSDEELNSYIETEFEKTHVPGMSVQIVNSKDVLFTETYGNCDSLNSGFVIGSLSKSFTAVSIMQLVEDGKLDLSDPISDYLPEVGKDTKTTILQLLNQTSGIKTYDTVESFTTSDTAVPFEYANANYALLGKIVENVSGMDYSSYVQTNIFEPLGMAHSYTSLEEAKDLTPGYSNYFGLMSESKYTYPDTSITGWLPIPAGYIISSTNDMGRYLQMYLNSGEDILYKTSIEEMMFNSVEYQDGYKYGFGLGTSYNNNGELIVEHGGNVENYTTYMLIMPERDVAVIALFNAGDFFVANDMAITLTNNILNKYIGLKTEDIADNAYIQSHILLDSILLIILLISILPLILFKRWRSNNTGKIRKSGAIITILLHLVLPTLILMIIPIFGTPLYVVQRFVPDVFAIILISSIILYITGVIKLVCLLFKYHANSL